ncbi:MAG: hypothetical protein ACHQRK_06435 [Gemmatimonadales bacterium]
MPDDSDAARAFLVARLGGTRYEARALEQLDSALTFEDPEYLAVLAHELPSDRIRGLVLFGTVSGARGVVKLHLVLGDDVLPCERIVCAVRDVAVGGAERLIVAELPDDAPFARGAAALMACGFVEEGRVEDFVRDGVAMRMLTARPS